MSDLYLIIGLTAGFVAIVMGGVALATRDALGRRAVSRLETMVSSDSVNMRETELSRSFSERALLPLVSGIGSLARRVTPTGSHKKIAHRIVLAGSPHGWTVERIGAYKILGAIGGAAAGYLLAGVVGWAGLRQILAMVAVAGMGFFVPDARLASRVEERQKAIRLSLADTIDLLTISVEAGLSFDAALGEVTRSVEGPLSQEIGRMLQEMQLGVGRAQAFRDLGARTEVEDLNGFVLAMVQAENFGVSVSKVLRAQARDIRLKRRQYAEEQAHKIPVKLLFPMMLCVMPALFVVVIGPGIIRIMEGFGNF